MILIVDSHALVWAATARNRLSTAALTAIADRANSVFVSVATAYELEFKRGRDPVLAALPDNLDQAVTGQSLAWLPLGVEHALRAARLPRHHGDPFDRMIIAQAFVEGAAVVTADGWFPRYGAPVVW